ncbi:MAG: MATE family efflux transporter [Oscillospiraceae bacterium]|nr:MATE family efflux transporter [Oscillospiraceae bacterium]
MQTTTDFTKGNAAKAILRFYFPMLATAMLQQFYSFADTAIVGKGLGDNALAAVGNMSSLCFLIFGFSMGLANGFCVLVAQHYGEKNFSQLRKTIAAMIRLTLIITASLTALSLFYLRRILILLQTDPLIISESLHYGYFIFGGLFAAISYNMSAGILRSLGDSRTPLKAIVLSSVLNILMDCLFIFVLHTGVTGAAAATVLSQIISAGVCISKLLRIDFLQMRKSDLRCGNSLYAMLLKNGVPMALMNSITAVGCMAVQYYVNGLGVAYTSAYSACSKYINMFMQPACIAGSTMSAYTGQNYGAGRFDRIREGLHICCLIAGISYLALGSVMFCLPRQLASLLLHGEQPVTYAAEFLPICGVMLFAVDLLFVYRNAVQGMGFPLVPMLSGILEMVLRIGTISLLIGALGFRATAIAEVCAWSGALLLNAAAFRYIFSRESRKAHSAEGNRVPIPVIVSQRSFWRRGYRL